MAVDTTTPRTRRAVLSAGLGALAALFAGSVRDPRPVDAASIQLGATNSTNKPTTIRNTARKTGAKAFIGRVTSGAARAASVGVQGTNAGRNANGVVGISDIGPNARGVFGQSADGNGVVGSGQQGAVGFSAGDDGTGVLGWAAGDFSSWGVFGLSDFDWGIVGVGVGGVAGVTEDPGGSGVMGFSGGGADSAGVYGESESGWAGYFAGDVLVEGDLTAPTAVVQMDHPEAPNQRWYRQALVGSLERISVISGNVRTDGDGRAVVRVPADFAKLHRGFRYQLTSVGKPASLFVARQLRNGRFVIGSDQGSHLVSWQLTGVRDDPYARQNRFSHRPLKPSDLRGRLAHPALHDRPSARTIRPMGRSVRTAVRSARRRVSRPARLDAS